MKSKADECKEQGNKCMKEEKFTEAVIHYSQAIQHEPNTAALYSNRSLAFLKIDQLYLALEDAKKTISLEPNWPKGFFRKGEVEFKAGHYDQALISYRKGMILDPTDTGISGAISKTNREMAKDRKDAARKPLLYSCIGLALGVLIVAADQYLTKKPAIQYSVLQVLLVTCFGAAGYGIAKLHRYIVVSQRESMLVEPLDLLKEMDDSNEKETKPKSNSSSTNSSSHKHHNQATGRQRMRKGKS